MRYPLQTGLPAPRGRTPHPTPTRWGRLLPALLLLLASFGARAQAPANDNPSGAFAIPITADCTNPTQGTNVGATTTTTNGYSNPGCGIAASPKDVWYTFTTAATGPTSTAVQINITGNPAGQVRVFSTANGAAGPFTQVACSSGGATNTVAPNFFANGLTPSTTYYIFVSGYGSTNPQGAFTLCVTDPPPCLPVTGLSFTNITTTSASVDFTPSNGNNSFTVTYTAAGGTAQTATGTSSPIALTGLMAGTDYSVSVQPTCGMGTAAATTGSFTTTCVPFTAPYSNNFDGVAAPALPACFGRIIQGGGTGALVATVSSTLSNSAPNYLRIYPNSTTGQAILVSPEFSDLNSGSNLRVRFQARSSTSTAANIATLQVGVLTDPADASTFTPVGSPITTTTTFTQYIVPLTGFSAGQYVGFRVTSPNTGSSIYLDDFTYEVTPACGPPANVAVSNISATTASVTFAAGAGNNSFTVTATPTAGGAPITATGPASPIALSGLTVFTSYSVTVTATCAGGLTATSSPAVTFTTTIINDNPDGAIAIPITADCTNPTQGTNENATTTAPNGYTNPGCGAAGTPRDVWYTFTTAASGPTATGVRINVTGNPAGQVRVFSTANGAAGPFTQVACSAGATNNTVAPDFVASGLTASTTYYVFVSGFGSSDTQGAFTLCITTPPAPLAGIYTINDAQATGGRNFTSFTDAAAALNFGGISAAVTFNVSGGPYTEQLLLNQITGSSAANTITFNGNGRTIQFAPTVSAQRAVVALNGTDFVILDGLNVDATVGGTSTSTFGFGIQLYNNADNNIIRNNTVTTSTTATTTNYVGISVSASATSGTGAGTGANVNVLVENNTVTGGDSGITLVGNSSSTAGVPTTGLVARGNTVTGFNNEGIYSLNTDGVLITGNDIARPVRAGTAGNFYGVRLGAGVRSARVEGNRIHQAFAASTGTSTTYGIYVTTGTAAAAGTENTIANNLVYDLDGNGTVYGLYNTGAFNRFYFNTVNINDQTFAGSNAAYGFYNSNSTSGSTIDLRNNILQVTRAGSGAKYALYFTTTAAAVATTSDYNDLTGTGTNFFVARINSPANNYATLADWQNNPLAPGKDANSVSVAPGFASLNNLTPSEPALDGAGQDIAGITTDFAGTTRTSPPDIGAVEFMVVARDLGAVALLTPTATQSCYGAAEAVTVNVRNFGTAPLNFANNPATVTVVVTLPGGGTQTLTTTLTSGTLAVGTAQAVTLPGTLNMTAVGTYSFAITASVTGDQNANNNALTPDPTITKSAPTAGTLSPATNTVCTGSTATLTLSGSANGDIQFQSSSSATGPFTNVTTGTGGTTASFTTGALTQTTYFQAVTTCGALTATSNVSTITINDPQPVSTNAPQTICAGSTATLTATGSTGQTFQFFDTASGGTPLTSTTGGTASDPTESFTTPALTANTTYYVQTTSDNSETVGRSAPTSGTAFGSASNYGLIFDVLTPTTLQSVTVVSIGGSGPITIEWQDASGTVLASATGTVAAGTSAAPVASVIPLNFALTPGTGYRLTQTTAVSLVRESGAGGFPYNSSGGSVSITNGLLSGSTSNNYYWFYDWVLGSSCTGTRTALQVNVNPAPTFTTTQSNVACFGGTGSITVTAAGGTGSFEYSNDNGATFQTSNTFSGLTAGTYQVLVRNLGGAQCPAAAAQAVTITAPASAVSVTATKTDVTAFGAMDGTITAMGMGGTSPYQYSIDGTTFQTSGTFTGLNPGSYTVTVRDANACTATTTITVGGATTAPCNAPTALSAGSITNTSATVSFTGSSSATSYTVTTTPATTTQTLGASATSVGFTGLMPGTAYQVSIVSSCAGGQTSAPATVSFTTTATCNAVTGLAASNVTSSSATVSFTGSASATSYTVTTSPATTTQTLVSGATSVSFTGLMASTAYQVNIVSNCAGGLTATATTTFTTQAPPCNAPTNLTAGSVTSNSATVTFTGSASATSYTVTTSPATTTQTLPAGSTSVNFTGLMTNTAYTVSIVSNCAGGATSAAATASFTTGAAPCNAPTALSAGSITNTSASVTFTASNSATGYTVTTTPATTTQTLGASATSVSFTGLMPGTAYQVSIVSNCAGGVTSSPATVSFTTTATCNAATGLTASSVTTNSATVSFTGSSSATSYTVTTSPATTTQTLPAGSTSATFAGLMASTSYTVSIRSNCAGGLTATATTTFTTATPPCNAATNLSAGSITASSATVSFTGSASATSYTVTTTPATTPQTLGASATSVALSGLMASTSYTVSIVSNCAGGQTSAAATTTFTTSAAAPNNLTVSSTQGGISGTFNNVTITSTGNATLGGTLTVNGTLTVQTGGALNTNCQTVNGAGSFVMQPGTTLSICDPAGISASGATGAIQTTGTRSFAADASYVYNGTAAQVTGAGLPATVRNLTVANAAGVTQTQGVSVAQLLTLTSGNLATGGQPLTLLSSAAGTAVVVNTGGVVTGTATVQRFIDPSLNPGLGYRHYSAPVSNTTLADLTTPTGFAPVLNPAYNTSPTPSLVTPFPTVFGYDETRVGTVTSNYGLFDQGFFSPAAASAPMMVGQGYTVNISASQLVDFTGTLNNGTLTKSGLTRGTTAQSGWHLLGNPFPSPLDVSAFVPANFTNVDNAVYVYRSTGQYVGQYTTYVNGIGTAQPVATAQGFFVRASTAGTAGTLTMPQSARVTTFGASAPFQRGTADTRPRLQLDLSGATGTDAAYVYFEAGATSATPEATRDAVKLPNPTGLNLASAAANGEELAINGLPLLAAQPVIVPLRLTAPVAGSYTFAVAELANFDATTVVELRDALTGTVQTLTPQTSLRVSLPAGATGSRFTLVFRPGAILATRGNLDAALVNLYPNPAHGRFVVELPALTGASRVEATLLNALGQQVRTQRQALNAQGTTLEFGTENLAAGVYSLRLQAGELQVVKRVVVE